MCSRRVTCIISFGPQALIRPQNMGLIYDTSKVAGKNSAGEPFTYADQYAWLGYTAREMIFDILNEVVNNKTLTLDMFAYELNEPDVLKILLSWRLRDG